VSGINRWALYSSTFPQIFYCFLKDPGPLNSKKRIWAVKQLFMCTDRIMWPPASKIRYRDDTCMILSQYRVYTSIIEANLYTLFICIFSRILDSPQSIDRVLSLFSSRPNWGPLTPSNCLQERGWGVPVRTRGQTLWFSRYICTLWYSQPWKSAKQILQKSAKLKSVRAIFDVFSRYRSIAGEHMWNLQNDKYDSGRTHAGIYTNKECVLPLSTR
jgi:hypothetical protein